VSGQRKALIVANDEYEQEALQNLLAPAADAEALGRVLGDPQIGDFAVQVVRNEPAHVIQAQIEDLFSESRPDDVLLLHFSGHGLKGESGELFFAASNTRPNRLGSTAVPADFVQRCMRDSRSRSVVLLLDCCYGGAFAQGVRVRAAGDVNVLDSFPQGRSGGGRGRAVITASSAMEYAFEGDQLGDDQQRRPSVFTSALVEGLATGDADQDEDGWVSLDELYDYVFDKVREQNPHQTPSRRVELEGELYLARSRRRRIRPVSIPADLQAALADPNMYTRLGAVTELRSRLASDDLPAAAGVYEALAELARTAPRYLADPAAEALSEAAVQPAQTELHFGRIEQGSAPPHQLVQLFGPPIARACLPRPSDDWIRVDEVDEGLDISIDTAAAGTLHGSLALKGPTGEAVIAIDVDLVSPRPQTPTSRRQSGPAHQGVMAPAPPAGQPEGQPAPPPPPASQLPQSDSPLPMANTPSHDVSGRASPARDVPPADSEPFRPQPGQQAAEHQPRTAKAPGAETAQEDKSAPAAAAPGEAPHPAGSQQGPAQESTMSRPERQSSAPFVWAAGSAVLGVVLFVGALIHFVTGSSIKPLWQTVLAVAVLGVLIAGFERPFKRLGTFVHGWNFIWSICLALFILKLLGESPLQIVGNTDRITALVAVGAVGNAICTAVGFVLVARGARGASNVILSITTGLITVALLLLALANANGSFGLFRGGGVVLFAASFASLLESVVVLAERSRSRTG
jgi:Caspase domain